MTFAIGDSCLDVLDLTCVTVCPVDCIYEGGRRAYIHPGECIDCGACVPVCPVDAITGQGYDGPDHNAAVSRNLEFFTEVLPGRDAPIGSPGSAHDTGRIAADTARTPGRSGT